MQSVINRFEAERTELDSILSSGVLGRSNNLVRLLTFVCEKYFEGTIDEVKEYTIAVQAFGRSNDFDPQVDTIVRVTAHALRKRLEDYYRTVGAAHGIHICLPPGHYAPKFIHKDDLDIAVQADQQEIHTGQSAGSTPASENGFSPGQERSLSPPPVSVNVPHVQESGKTYKFSRPKVWVPALVLVAVAIVSVSFWYRQSRSDQREAKAQISADAISSAIPGKALRALVGDRAPYVDRSGFTWEKDRFCNGGSSFSISGHAILGTEDAQLFTKGRRGIFHCSYPVPAGVYEVHLLFAETSGILDGLRNVAFSINSGSPTNLDVVDDAGGNDIAITKVLLDITPAGDGMIHLDFNTPDSFLNAVEILPGVPHRMLPIRIIAGPSLYSDSEGNIWMPDRYFFGGRVTRFGGDLSKIPDGGIYDWHRFGHFRYILPVAPTSKYTLKLYFLEHWFGVQSGAVGGVGGVGSRVFDVSCNGTTLLKHFDIFQEAGTGPLVKTFLHIEPTAQGKLEIYFTPAINYPSISAIEVIPE